MKLKCCLVAISVLGIALWTFGAQSGNGWSLVKQTNGIAIYSRPHPGSNLKEFKAIGEIDAPTKTVHNVIDDVEAYPTFMPYTTEARVIERNNNSVLTYQRLSPRIVSDRDYTLRIEKKSWPAEDGLAYLNEWTPANERGPAEKPGVFRVKTCDGSWLIEPIAPNKTRATYSVFTDSGISVPPVLANTISQTGISKLFVAVRNQAKNLKYQAK